MCFFHLKFTNLVAKSIFIFPISMNKFDGVAYPVDLRIYTYIAGSRVFQLLASNALSTVQITLNFNSTCYGLHLAVTDGTVASMPCAQEMGRTGWYRIPTTPGRRPAMDQGWSKRHHG